MTTLIGGNGITGAGAAVASPPAMPPVEAAPGGALRVAARTARQMVLGDVLVVGIVTMGLAAVTSAAIELALLLWVCTIASFGIGSLYATARWPDPSFIGEARRLLASVFMGLVATVIVASLVAEQVLDRRFALGVIVWAALVATCSLATRRGIRRRARTVSPERVLIIGAGVTGQELAGHIRRQPNGGRTVVGFVDDDPFPLQPGLSGIPVFGGTTDIASAIEQVRPDRIVIAFTRRAATEILEDLRCSEARTIPISVIPRYHEITPSHAALSEVGGMPLVDIHSAQLSRGARVVKRTFDFSLATAGVIMLSPLLVGVAIAIKLTSPGPVFFRQERTGRDGRTFRIWKFRTMVQDAEAQRMALAHLNDMDTSAPLFKMREDPRITKVGRVLRKYSIDELPQLFNVVGGSMSLVGPRPFVVHEADQMQGWSRRRLDLTPGITGLWQVRGRNDVPYEEMIRLDCMYVANWSPLWDLRILIETIPQVLLARGAS